MEQAILTSWDGKKSKDIEIITEKEYVDFKCTFCGVPISFKNPNGQRREATFGGIIKVVFANGNTELFGMTSGHAIHQWDEDIDEDVTEKRSSQNSHSLTPPTSPSPSLSPSVATLPSTPASPPTSLPRDEEFLASEIDEDNESEPNSVFICEILEVMVNDAISLGDFEDPTVVGRVLDISKDLICSDGRYYDWALFRPTCYKMNRAPNQRFTQFKISDKRPDSILEPRRIVVLSEQIRFSEIMLDETGQLLLGGEQFIDTFLITMEDGGGIYDGDSGSWVVDMEHCEVYGQLVASDRRGVGYVVPMVDIFNDIKSQLGALSVELPLPEDIPYEAVPHEIYGASLTPNHEPPSRIWRTP
ncbi:hypothetical protein GGR51DRAFT_544376 [Nemania sp. FL0031]|nr:hypothetical protein GGR51DRAFT_544376 [Nemania sp. FL0031]